jgi:hypothetical protein
MQPRISVTPETDDLFAGSMHRGQHRGRGPLPHPAGPKNAPRDDAPAPTTPTHVETPGIALDFSEASMVKAFVMQEILTRPCERHRRRA